jgi:hypothetical protein
MLLSVLSWEARFESRLTSVFPRWLKLVRVISRSSRRDQELPWLRHEDRLNPWALLDRPPHIHWYRDKEVIENLEGAGFQVVTSCGRRE